MSEAPDKFAPRLIFAQWFGVAGPPLVWLVQFEARYALAANDAGSRAHGAMFAIALAGLGVLGVCAVVAWRQWRWAAASPLDRFAQTESRARFMGALGLLSCGLFALVMVAQLLAQWFLEPGKS